MKALACMFTQACAKLYKKAGLQLMSLSAPSQMSEGLHGQSRHHICQSQPRSRDGERARSPPEGGRPVMAYGKHRRPEKNFQNTIANIQHAPSFIGENATSRFDWTCKKHCRCAGGIKRNGDDATLGQQTLGACGNPVFGVAT